MSSGKSFLPTPVSEFIDFLHGKTVPVYGNSKETVSALSSFLYTRLRQQYAEFLSIRMKSSQHLTESESIQDVDIVNFLISVFPSPFDLIRKSPINDMIIQAFAQLNDITAMVLFQWLARYRESELDTLVNPSSQASQFERFSQSSVRTLLYQLLQDSCAFPYNINEEIVAQKCGEIKDAIVYDLKEYLSRLLINEANEARGNSRHTPPGPEVVSGGSNQQDGTRQHIEHKEWFLAWEDEFRGSALENLEVKLILNVQALQNEREDKRDMSRIIPIVQSSGTGKSRLAEQYTN